MSTVAAYQGVVEKGVIRLTPNIALPEGSHVYVTVAGDRPIIDEATAQRKVTRWLVEYVGNMVIANEGRLVESDGRLVWRFGAFVTQRGRKPLGPIGYADVDAYTGEAIASEEQAQELIAHGETFIRSLP
jgi:hypothetical protein